MQHLLFPSQAAANAFVSDLQTRGLAQPELGRASLNRTAAAPQTPEAPAPTDQAADHNDPAMGAVAGTGYGLGAGVVTGVLATIVTGGAAAIPVVLGMAALGAGIGAGVGAASGPAIGSHSQEAGGLRHTSDGVQPASSDLDEDRHGEHAAAGRLLAVDDRIPADVVDEVAARHGGHRV